MTPKGIGTDNIYAIICLAMTMWSKLAQTSSVRQASRSLAPIGPAG